MDYFIGSMVVFKDGKQRFGIVDGQQRMTTMTLLLAVLRNALAKHGLNDLAQGIHGLIERKNIDNKPEFILSTETSYPFFQDHILKWGAPDVPVNPLAEEKNLQDAFTQLTKLIDGVTESQESDTSLSDDKKTKFIQQRLTDIRDAVLNLKVIFVKLDDEDDAYIIFETLNTRGKDLSLTDLVKNHINKHLKSKSASIDPVKVKWHRMLETIEAAASDLETDAFIHHFWLSRYDYLSAKTLFKALKRRITKTEAKAFLDSLVADATIYRMIHEITFGKWSKQERRVPEALGALQLFRVQQQIPCVLSLLRSYRGKTIKMRHLEDALVAIERFHFLFTAVTSQRSSGGISEMYASLGRRLFESNNQDSALAVLSAREGRKKTAPLSRAVLPLASLGEESRRSLARLPFALAKLGRRTWQSTSTPRYAGASYRRD
jgi:hypothetical protein